MLYCSTLYGPKRISIRLAHYHLPALLFGCSRSLGSEDFVLLSVRTTRICGACMMM